MYIAMNQFTVDENRHQEFEDIWTNRERHLDQVPGFKHFQLLKGESKEGKRVYISKSHWENAESFWNWTKSEAFALAHKNKTPQGIILGPPQFNGYEVILSQ